MRSVIELELVATLDVAAASSVVAADGALWVVADDELGLRRYDLAGRPLGALPLLPGALPAEPRARKRRKPDLEALALLPGGALLALGSGSLATRHVGAVVTQLGPARPVDLAPLCARLAEELPDLNLEGAAVRDDALVLLQRGNGPAGVNAVIELDLAGVLTALAAAAPRLDARLVRRVTRVALGELAGAPLGFTDAAPHPRGILFTAAAEPSASTYDDAPCTGSALGLLGPEGAVLHLEPCAPVCKIEGVTLLGDDVYLVADADDPAVPAPLFRARRPW